MRKIVGELLRLPAGEVYPDLAHRLKADFVRKLSTASPKEIIAKAKAEGIKLDLDYVYKIRSSAKAGKTKKTMAKKTSRSRDRARPCDRDPRDGA